MLRKEQLPVVIVLNRDQLQLSAAGLPEVLTLTFSGDAVRDLEVDNRKTLERQVVNWLEPLQLAEQPALLILMEETYFSFDSANLEVTTEDPAYQEFLNLVPFEDPLITTFPLTQGSRTLALSRELIQPVVEILRERGLRLAAVSPAFAFGENLAKGRTITAEQATGVAHQMATALQYNFLPKDDAERALHGEEEFLSVRLNTKVIALIGVLILLLGILGVLIWFQQQPAQQASVPPPAPAVVPVTPTPVASAVPSPTTRVVVQVQGQPESELVSLLEQELEASGYFQPRVVASEAATEFRAVLPEQLDARARQSLLDILAASPETFAIVESAAVQEITLSVGQVSTDQ